MNEEFETLAKLPHQARQDVERYCAARAMPYERILSASRGDIWAMARVHGLISHLAALKHSLRVIHTAAGVEQAYALRVIEAGRRAEVRVRTTEWERAALCRR